MTQGNLQKKACIQFKDSQSKTVRESIVGKAGPSGLHL